MALTGLFGSLAVKEGERILEEAKRSFTVFDIRCVHGECSLVEGLQAHASKRAKKNRIFRRFMAANALSHRPPLGFFRRFVQEDDGSHSEGLNLKHRGIVPITDLVRIRALEGGISEALITTAAGFSIVE